MSNAGLDSGRIAKATIVDAQTGAAGATFHGAVDKAAAEKAAAEKAAAERAGVRAPLIGGGMGVAMCLERP